ncbi:hypothetical protein [Bosea massiliensis]|uniref:Uncharacterized protein n=1 Tax=Bosea massiliensis TaxID=151419 RepID=A0ABW0NY90_9HYPH
MAKPMIKKVRGYDAGGHGCDAFAIRVGGKKGRLWAPAGATRGAFATYETRARAERFIAEGGLIEVETVSLTDALAASGWVEEEGHSDANRTRFREWTIANSVYLYARPKEKFFPAIGIRNAQRLGLSKIVMEDLS